MQVLVVDDDSVMREFLSLLLYDEGHKVSLAGDGQTALDACDQAMPDMVIMDSRMPHMDGETAARNLRERYPDHFLPILFLTGLYDRQDLLRFLRAGDDFLSKPVDVEVLRAKLQNFERQVGLYQQVHRQNRTLHDIQQKMQAEYQLAHYLMGQYLERMNPEKIPGIRSHLSSQALFNGDLAMGYQREDGRLYLLLGDFTGHGLVASVGVMPVSGAFQRMTRRRLPLPDMARELNRLLKRFLPPSMFMAAVILELDPQREQLQYWMGGLPDGYAYSPGGEVVHRLSSRHMPLGILDNSEFDARCDSVTLPANTRILLCSDGVAEARNRDGYKFGEGSVCLSIQEGGAEALDCLLAQLKTFTGQEYPEDDISVVEICCQPQRPMVAGMADQPSALQPVATEPLFRVEFFWGLDQLRSPEPLSLVQDWLKRHSMVDPKNDAALTVISELFSNAVDHGLLGLDSRLKDSPEGFERFYAQREERLASLTTGHVRLEAELLLERGGAYLDLLVSDSGSGYARHQVSSVDELNDAHGRGLLLVQSLCSQVTIRDQGATVRAVVPLSPDWLENTA